MSGEPAREPAGAAAPLPTWVRAILCCPACHEALQDDPAGVALVCRAGCGGGGRCRRFPVTDGIPVLLLDEAELLPAGE